MLDREQFVYQRVRYTILDILAELGGLGAATVFVFSYLFSIYNYRHHEAQVWKEWVLKDKREKEENLLLNWF